MYPAPLLWQRRRTSDPTDDSSSKVAIERDKIAFTAALLFLLNPASVFFSAGYSESLFCLCCLVGLNALLNRNHLGAALAFGVSSLARSNGILYTIILGAVVIANRIAPPSHPQLTSSSSMPIFTSSYLKRVLLLLLAVLEAALLCALSVAPFFLFQLYIHSMYCGGSISDSDADSNYSRLARLLESCLQAVSRAVLLPLDSLMPAALEYAADEKLTVLGAPSSEHLLRFCAHRAPIIGTVQYNAQDVFRVLDLYL